MSKREWQNKRNSGAEICVLSLKNRNRKRETVTKTENPQPQQKISVPLSDAKRTIRSGCRTTIP